MALLITALAGLYQRLTGPTYPTTGSQDIAGHEVSYDLETSHGGAGDQPVVIHVGQAPIVGVLHFKRFKIDEPFTLQDMRRAGDSLVGHLPHQPPAGKLEYYVELIHEDGSILVPGPQTVVTRFKGDVPIYALLPHVLLMFLGMLWSNRAGLEALTSQATTKNLTLWTTIILFVGGLILGPMVQKFAFGAFWTGAPVGWDLTDNKTLIFVIVWVIALWRHKYNPAPRRFVLAAALITVVMYMIPHSMMGSELDHSTGEVTTG